MVDGISKINREKERQTVSQTDRERSAMLFPYTKWIVLSDLSFISLRYYKYHKSMYFFNYKNKLEMNLALPSL